MYRNILRQGARKRIFTLLPQNYKYPVKTSRINPPPPFLQICVFESVINITEHIYFIENNFTLERYANFYLLLARSHA